MADDLTTLSRRLASDGPAPVTLVQGEERLLVDEAVRQILAAAVDNPEDAMSVTRLDMAESGYGNSIPVPLQIILMTSVVEYG